jgi:hypothetical protein
MLGMTRAEIVVLNAQLSIVQSGHLSGWLLIQTCGLMTRELRRGAVGRMECLGQVTVCCMFG